MKQFHDEDDEKVLKDGERVRVPMCLMDGVQKSISGQHHRAQVVDAMGQPAGRRPGSLYLNTPESAKARGIADAKRVTHEAILSDRWKGRQAHGGGDGSHQSYVDRISNAWKQGVAA